LNPFKWKRFPNVIRRILIVETLKIGDLLVATPVFRAVKKHWKNAEVDVLVAPACAELLQINTDVHEIIPYTDFNTLRKIIKGKKYDLAILLHEGSFSLSWLLFRAGITYRVGGTKTGIRYGKGFFLHKKIQPNNRWQHKIEDNLDVARAIGADTKNKRIELPVDPAAKRKIQAQLKKYGEKIFGIHAPSQHQSQQWIPERFAAVADRLVENYHCSIVFTGIKNEREYIETIIKQTTHKNSMINYAGKTTMQEFIALIDSLKLLISIDTGAIHIASARNVPTVALFGPTIPTFWGPSHERKRIIWKQETACVGCRKYYCVFDKNYECMRSITVEDVVNEAGLLLKKK
jgi:lipopolysaccharide heptosyltransferase II